MAQHALESFPRRPRWFDEEFALQQLLDRFLDKIEQTRKLTLRVNAKTLPELYDADSTDAEYLWALIKELDKEYHILTVKPATLKANQPAYENAQIFFVPEKEALVREWLNRPRLDPYALLWEKYLQKYAHNFEDDGAALADNIVRVSHKSPEHILQGFAKIGGELRERMTLRALSARCFWGDSKFLDRRLELVNTLYPGASRLIIRRPILLNCYIPNTIERVLFVENQDAYLMLVNAAPTSTALVYSAGLRGTASRIREPGNATFAQMAGNANDAGFDAFQQWWFSAPEANRWPVQFWGDLDFAGCAIIKTLRQSFPELTAWPPGYRPLLAKLERGEGHGHRTSGKEFQKDPITTGCAYTDEELLVTIRDTGMFCDQEAVLASDLEGFR